jgi:hypothetical protein
MAQRKQEGCFTMFPPRSPERVQNAHTRIIPIYEFLAKYERWIAASGGDNCDFALGNPQTMPLDEFVVALRDATTPKDKSWYGYKMNEMSSREKYLHVGVFSGKPLSGNGVTVFRLRKTLPAAVMQELTREMRQFKSIFVLQKARQQTVPQQRLLMT